MNPPIPDESHCTTISPIPVIMENVVVEAPEFGQGETDVRPIPAPRAARTSVMDNATKVPAKIAAQLTAECEDSFAMSPVPVGIKGPMLNAISRRG